MGRPRKPGPRGTNGRLLKRADRGVAKLREMRAWLAGMDEQGDVVGDPAKTVYPLGVMFASGLIDESTHRAGCRYAWLHALVYGRVSISGARYGEMAGGEDLSADDPEFEKWLKARKRELKRADAAFTERRDRDLVVNLAVFERSPRWLLPCVPTRADVAESERTMAALADLRAMFTGADRLTAKKRRLTAPVKSCNAAKF